MKHQLKSVFRRPIVTLLLFLLIGSVTFGATARLVEYLVVNREIDRLSDHYRAIGFLADTTNTEGEERGYVTEGVRLLRNSDLISLHDRMSRAAGALTEYYNADLDGITDMIFYPGMAEVLFRGTVVDKVRTENTASKTAAAVSFSLLVTVQQRLSGYPEYAPKGETVQLTFFTHEAELWEERFADITVGRDYVVRGWYDRELGKGNFLVQKLLPLPGEALALQPDAPGVAAAVTEDSLREVNRRSVEIVACKDMSSLPYTQEASRSLYLTEGRWLNYEDQTEAEPVCVIHQRLAEARGIGVGDTLTVALSNLQSEYLGYFPPETTAKDLDALSHKDISFTVVGIMSGRGHQLSSAVAQRIYIPEACLPEICGSASVEAIHGDDYSFVLHSPKEKETFLERYQEPLAQMGISVQFVDNGWDAFAASAQPIRRSTLVNTIIFAAVQGMTLALAAWLYLRQHRREFAIARALGVPALTASWHMLQPLVAVGGIAILGGGDIAWRYALKQADKTLASLETAAEFGNAALPRRYLLMACGASLAVLILVMLGLLAALGRRSVMDILREGQARPVNRRLPAETDIRLIAPERSLVPKEELNCFVAAPEPERQMRGSTRNAGFALRYQWRSPGKVLLMLTAASAFMIALGWLQRSIQETQVNIDELYENTVVDTEILSSEIDYGSDGGVIHEKLVRDILDTGYMLDARLVGATVSRSIQRIDDDGTLNEDRATDIPLRGIRRTKDLEKPVNSQEGVVSEGGVILEKGAITFGTGWDETLFSGAYQKEGDIYPVVLSESLLESIDAQVGDRVQIRGNGTQKLVCVVAGVYAGYFNGLDMLTSARTVLLPQACLELFLGRPANYSIAEFTVDPLMNRELGSIRSEICAIMEIRGRGLNFVIWDQELREVVEPMERNLTLMQVLYPVALAVSILISVTLAFMLLLQEAKAAAILRVLGIPRASACWMLGGGQLLLCTVGVLVGFGLALALGKWTSQLPLCGALYLLGGLVGTVAGCAAVTRRKPLELLQVKE